MMTHSPNSPCIPIIGLLGAVASGKSAVASELEHLGAVVFDADEAVGELLGSEEIASRIASEVDGGAVVSGTVDRRCLADLIFRDERKRAALEAILHPPVIDAARELIASPPAGASAIVIDAPLLLEAGMGSMCDELWFVDTPREQRVSRARRTRGWSVDELDRREDAQISPDEKRRRADRIISNATDLESLARVVNSAWKSFMGGR